MPFLITCIRCCNQEIRLPAENEIEAAQRRRKAPYAVSGCACCALPSNRRPKIQPVITTFSAGEFCWQLALSNNIVHWYFRAFGRKLE